MRLWVRLMFPLLLLTGCGSSTPPAEPAPAAAPATPAPAASVADRVPADHVLQPQLQALDRAHGVQQLNDAAKERVDAAVDEQQP